MTADSLLSLTDQYIVVQAERVPLLMRFAQHVQAYQSLVDLVGASAHVSSVLHIVSLPIAELRVAACLVEVGGLADDQLAHLVDEVGLTAGKQPEHRCCLQALADEKLLQIHLFIQLRLCLNKRPLMHFAFLGAANNAEPEIVHLLDLGCFHESFRLNDTRTICCLRIVLIFNRIAARCLLYAENSACEKT